VGNFPDADDGNPVRHAVSSSRFGSNEKKEVTGFRNKVGRIVFTTLLLINRLAAWQAGWQWAI
jgi:hypothetical protein